MPIISINGSNTETISYRISRLQYPFTFFLDIENKFLEYNSFIPKDKRFHTFLIDTNNRVVFIGDPTLDESLMALFLQSINNHN